MSRDGVSKDEELFVNTLLTSSAREELLSDYDMTSEICLGLQDGGDLKGSYEIAPESAIDPAMLLVRSIGPL